MRTIYPNVSCAVLVAVGLAATPDSLDAQEPVELGAPVAAAAEPLSSIAGLRELSGGALLVADGLEGRLLRMSADLTSVTPIGREGAGPGEYRTPDALFAMAADSTLMVDLGNGRLAVLGPSGAIDRTFPIAGGEGPRLSIRLPGGVDAGGSIYFRQRGRPGPGGVPDSGVVVRYDPHAEETMELAAVKTPAVSLQESGPANARNVQMRPVPLSPEDVWTVTPEGRLVIARQNANAYWLDFVGPDGSGRGPEISYEPLPVRAGDREAWIAGLSGALGVSVEEENGRRRMSFSRGGAPGLQADDLEWPETKPAFPGEALETASDGNFWLQRHGPAGEPT
ncbi:MAG: hypothetical protein R3266_01165, partial [Gemmatimonadota bacterium]|nr:hypothetical protein [Gemmatimonadota bacterium]